MRVKVEKDYEELLQLFNKHNVKYCIAGSYALAFYARPRYTKDMDIIVEHSTENAHRILAALREFGFGSLPLSEQDFTEPGQVIQLGYEPVRIDLIISIEGMDFDKIWKNRSYGQYGRQRVSFIGLNELMESKRKTGRSQDRVDLEVLEDVLKET